MPEELDGDYAMSPLMFMMRMAKGFEGMEVVLATSTMTVDEIRLFRLFHSLLQFMWGRDWYRNYLILFKEGGVCPVDLIFKIADGFRHEDGELGEVHRTSV